MYLERDCSTVAVLQDQGRWWSEDVKKPQATPGRHRERCQLSNCISLSSGSDIAESKNILNTAAPELATLVRCVSCRHQPSPFMKIPEATHPLTVHVLLIPHQRESMKGGTQTKGNPLCAVFPPFTPTEAMLATCATYELSILVPCLRITVHTRQQENTLVRAICTVHQDSK